MKTYLEFKDSKSQKFWSIEVHGTTTTVNYGKIGSQGRTQIKQFDSSEDAEIAAEKLIHQKEKKGYNGMSLNAFDKGKICKLSELRKMDGMSGR